MSLFINGTSGNDVISCVKDMKTGGVKVYFGDVLQGTYAPTGRIIINAGDGNDFVRIDHEIKLPVEIYGGAGNDMLLGGGGDDILVGGDGNDILMGRAGSDLMIGGNGKDMIFGGQGGDLEVGGATLYDNDASSLRALSVAWCRTDITFAQRSFNVQHGVGMGGSVKLDSSTIVGDPKDDMLMGGQDADLLLFAKAKAKAAKSFHHKH